MAKKEKNFIDNYDQGKKHKPILKSMIAFGKAMIEKTGEAIAKFLFWFIPDHKASLFFATIATGFAIGTGLVANPRVAFAMAVISGTFLFNATYMFASETVALKEYKEERKQNYEDFKRTTELEGREFEEVIEYCKEEDFTARNS